MGDSAAKRGYRDSLTWLFKAILLVAVWAAAADGVLSSHQDGLADQHSGFDLYQYWVGGDIVRTYRDSKNTARLDFYSQKTFDEVGEQYWRQSQRTSFRQKRAADSRRVLHTVATPFLYWLFSLGSRVDYDVFYHYFVPATLICLYGTLAALAWVFRYSWTGIGATILFASLSTAVYSDMRVINLNGPQIAVFTIYILIRHLARRSARPTPWTIVSGGIIGLLIAYKPNLALLALLLGLGRLLSERRAFLSELIGVLAGFSAAVVISSLTFGGLQCWIEWFHAAGAVGSRPVIPTSYGNISLTRTIVEWTGHDITMPLTLFVVAIATGAVWFGGRGGDSTSKDIEFRRDLCMLGLAGPATWMVSGFAWLHYPIQAFPFLVLAGSRLPRRGLGADIVRFAMLATCIGCLLYAPPEDLGWVPMPHFSGATPERIMRASQIGVGLMFLLAIWISVYWLRVPGKLQDENHPKGHQS